MIKTLTLSLHSSANEVIAEENPAYGVTVGPGPGGVDKLQFLQGNRDNTLQVHAQQDLDGNDVLNLAGSGSLYVQQMEESDDELPAVNLGPQEGASTEQLLQRADELIKELRVSCLLINGSEPT